MHSLEDILAQYKHSDDYKHGVSYFENAHVGTIHFDEYGKMIRADVEGSSGQTYSVDIRFAAANRKMGLPILRGFCNCPVGFNCKHVFATLLTVMDEFPDEKIHDILPLGFDQYEGKPSDLGADISKGFVLPPPMLQSPPSFISTYPEDLRTINLDSLSLHLAEDADSIDGHRVFYILEADLFDPPQLEIHVGSFSAQPLVQLMQPVNIHGILSSRGRIPPFANENDRAILQFAHAHQLLNISKRKSSIRIIGAMGAQILQGVSKTSRLYMRDQRQLRRLVPIPDEQVRLDWEFNHKFQTRIRASLPSQDILVHPLPTQPPMFAYLPSNHAKEAGNGCLGQLVNLSHEQIIYLRSQDWVYLEKQDKNYTLETDFIDPIIKDIVATLPLITAEDCEPKAHITVSHVSLENQETFEILELHFIYGEQKVSGFSSLETILSRKPSHIHYIRRNTEYENLFFEYISKHMKPVHQEYYLFNAAFPNRKGFWFGTHAAKNYKSRWVTFLTQHIPTLEAMGASTEIANDIEFSLDQIEDNSWFMQLDEDEEGSQWFNLALGFKVGDKDINLISVLLEHATDLPSLEELRAQSPGVQIPIEYEPGHFVFVDSHRIEKIMSTFYEILDPLVRQKKPKLSHFHAGLLTGFSQDFGETNIQWRGGDQIRQLGEQLSAQGQIPTIEPSEKLRASLRGYQKYGLSWMQFLCRNRLAGILADDMGLGKTLQTLTHLQLLLEQRQLAHNKTSIGPSLIVAPTSVVSTWIEEANKFTPNLSITQYYGTQRRKIALQDFDLVVTSYGVVRQDLDVFANANLYFLILDEAQAIKNPASKTASAVKAIQAEHKLCLTGTPIENHLGELWSIFDFLMPGFLSSLRRFNKKYRKPIEGQGDAELARGLKSRIAPFILRRTKDLVAKDLPPKTEMVLRSQLRGLQRDIYETVRLAVSDSVRKAISERGLAQSQIVILDAILKLRQICCHPSLVSIPQAKSVNQSSKLDDLMDLLEPLVEEGRSVLIFSSFASMLDIIAKNLEKKDIPYFILTGKTRNRDQLIKGFQAGERQVFLISLKAGGTGLTLTKADTVIHYDPWWNPAVEDQATDRAYRIGQDKPVFVYKLITESTIEEKMLALKERKRAIAENIYNTSSDQASGLHFSLEDLDNLFAPI